MSDNLEQEDGFKEILEFIDQQKGFSYYDLKAYVYNNDKYEWIRILNNRDYRGLISTYLKDKHRDEKVKYSNSLSKSVKDANNAKVAFYKRHTKNRCEDVNE